MSKEKDTVKKGGVDEGYRNERVDLGKKRNESYEKQVRERLYEELKKKE
ncbi:MAG: hypothetical protein IPQ18_06150 [Saprospiraceae bacterium]|jgi:hypothetical protein|nr:hypothetical protein [Saprospiraceae bacterium]MBL0190925.1 hypothetical protein [Saprospiraceae bacterium]